MNVREACDALDRLAADIAEGKTTDYAALIWSGPIDPAEIAAAEADLGVKLPPSYVELVTTRGCFKLVREAQGGRPYAAVRGCRGLLSPREIVKETLSNREGARENDEEETADMLDLSLCFHENHYRDNFYVFRTDDAGADGEMSVHHFYHDDEFVWSDDRMTFADHLDEWSRNVVAAD